MGSQLDTTYGALLIGVLFATFFQGILSLQAYVYHVNYPDDIWQLKTLVAVVWSLDAAHLVLIAQACYHYLVRSFGETSKLVISTPELDLHLIFVGLATLACQGFFLHRIWVCSRRNHILTCLLSAGCLVVFVLDVIISAQIITHDSVSYFTVLRSEVIAVFSIGAGVDLAIAIVLVLYLQQGKTDFHRTNSVLVRVVYFTVATGLATSILAIGCLVAYLVAPNTFIFIAMHFSLGRLYTNALLATLNSRQSLRLTPYTHPSAPSIAIMTTRVVTSTVDAGEYPMTSRSMKDSDLPGSPTVRVLPMVS
ncbi:hypothetical protein FB45DRAFT_1068349 [Roridomyces roridus]|uniref:DUF6534 domain-containing protein n=1 Tax=Roridomyces roridus TaxID=1738132 RepID=A0AAD7B0P2_9AGAR|nr:hypothetical protein FB45DRAFT_1068349 [Roridomyces roridus]